MKDKVQDKSIFQNNNVSYLELAKKGTVITCDNCGNDMWYPIFILVKVDKLQSKLTKDKIFPIQSYKCTNCGKVNRSLNPLEDVGVV